jgi:hypothetical protein
MVTVFLLGHLSSYIHLAVGEKLSFLTDIIFCVVPDMGVSFPARVEPDVPEGIPSLILYSFSYLLLILCSSTISLKPSLNRR